MIDLVESLLERYPSAGYLGALPSGIAGVVTWAQIDKLLGTVGVAIGLVVGVLTGLVQYENWMRKRKERKSAREKVEGRR